MKDIKVGVIGCGYWGPNLVRNFIENHHTDLVYVCDLNRDRIERIKLRYPHVRVTTAYRDLLKDDSVHAVAVATPVFTHYKLVKEALDAGKHVLVEKPLTASSKEAERLIALAAQRGLILFVDHTFIYTGAIAKIKEYLTSGKMNQAVMARVDELKKGAKVTVEYRMTAMKIEAKEDTKAKSAKAPAKK